MNKKTYFITFTTLIFLILLSCTTKNEDFLESGITLPLKESLIIDLAIESDITGRRMPVKIYFPRGYGSGKDFPVWYGLNGYGSSESMWINAGITKSADTLIGNNEIEPIIMVFPYTQDATAKEIKKDWEDDGKFDERNMDKFISRKLVPYIDSRYNTVASPKGRFIGGFSMGGAIALRIAFHHSNMFGKVGGYSPALTSGDYSDKQLEQWLYPNDNFDKIDDIITFDNRKGFNKLTIYLDAGNSNDPFFTGVQSLYNALQKRGIKSEFHPYDGGHSLDHNKRDFKAYLQFYFSGD